MDSSVPAAGSQQPGGSLQPPLPGTDVGGSGGPTEQQWASCGPSSGLVPRRAPEQIVVGEIRQNLDDLKSSILSYYSRLYAQPGKSIEERLDALAAPPFSNTVRTGRLPPADFTPSRSKKQQPFTAFPPPNTCFDFLEEEGKGPGKATTETDPSAAQKTFYGISQLPGQKAGPDMMGYDNLLGRSLDEARGGQINELLQDLRSKCTAASTRLNTISDQLERECGNPDLREWEYTTYPQVRRHPYLGRDPELRRHLLTIYRELCHQSQTNQLRISAIRSKLKVLNINTQSDMIKLKSDPRIAF
ncbi:uncharacterized protein EMH_0005790 [Eimeria mitis]|uniref:Uncharacterized protein n=1 Tax=Eimeria mitis TaxID=44415 RepID=U6JXJ9_9EIME|nr:uncharacterized protein EMH_0005790 [Eimeria mitis]CDJ30210.1 hypothetical protein, conserved [Eimeria mitis]